MGEGDKRPGPHSARYLRDVQYADGTKLGDRIALHERFSTNPTGWHRWLYDLIALQSSERVLEVGCGSGALWKANAERLPPATTLVLTDVSPGMLDSAHEALTAADVAARLVLQDAQALEFPEASFDVVVASHMLYHVPDRRRAGLQELRRVLVPGSRAVPFATNGNEHLNELDALMERYGTAFSRDDVTFTLENGEAQLAEVFECVERHDYADGLRVTEAGALVRYILSMPGSEHLQAGQIERFTAEAEALVARPSGFEVTKSSGAFICRV